MQNAALRVCTTHVRIFCTAPFWKDAGNARILPQLSACSTSSTIIRGKDAEQERLRILFHAVMSKVEIILHTPTDEAIDAFCGENVYV